MITTNMYHATYCKCLGFKIGKVKKVDALSTIEILGDEIEIQKCIHDYDGGAHYNLQKYLKELGYIKYLVKSK